MADLLSESEFNAWRVRHGRPALSGAELTKAHQLYVYRMNGGQATAAATPATTTAAAPITFEDPRLPQLQSEMQAIPGTFNDARRMSANDLLRQLISSGLTESGSLAEEAANAGVPDGLGGTQKNIIYKVIVGPGGKAYRQAYESRVASQNARGVLESSETRRQIRDDRGELDRRVNDSLMGLSDVMQKSLASQRAATTDVGNRVAGVKADVAQDLKNNIPPAATTAAPAATAAPATLAKAVTASPQAAASAEAPRTAPKVSSSKRSTVKRPLLYSSVSVLKPQPFRVG